MPKFFIFIAAGLVIFIASLVWWLIFYAQQPLPVQQVTQYTLRFGHNTPPDSALHLAAQKFAEQVRTHTQGQVNIQLFPDQQLGTDQQMVEMARTGELDIILTPTAKLSPLVPAMQYVDLPFFFPDRATLYQMLDGAPGTLLLHKLKTINLIGAAFWENGFKHFTAQHPIRTPDNLRGTTVRVMKSRLLREQFESLGAKTIFIDFHRLYQALRDGVADAQENPLVAIAGLKLYEVQSHLTLSEHGYLGYVLSFSARSMARLPPDLQTLLLTTARDLSSFERNETQRREAHFLEQIRASGTQIHQLDSTGRDAFRAALAHLPSHFELEIGADILSKTAEEMRNLRCATTPQQCLDDELVVGLDADISSGSAQAGVAIKRGILMAIEEINAQGGILGKQMVLLARDHRALPSIGLNNIRDFIRIPNLVAVFSGVHSPVALTELDIVHEKKVPFLIPWAAATALTENHREPNYVFRVSINDRLVAPLLVNYATHPHPARPVYERIALLLENSAWGRSNRDALHETLATREPVAEEWFNRGQSKDAYQAQLKRIERSGAEVILLVANPLEGIEIIRTLGQRAHPLPVVSHWGITGGVFFDAVADSLDKVDLVFPQTISHLYPRSPVQSEFIAHYQAMYGIITPGDIISPAGTAHAYELTHLLAQAIKQAGSTERSAVRMALEHIQFYDGLLKQYHPPFSPYRHDALTSDDYYLARYNKQGWIVPIQNK